MVIYIIPPNVRLMAEIRKVLERWRRSGRTDGREDGRNEQRQYPSVLTAAEGNKTIRQ